jgi:hypothetical protein
MADSCEPGSPNYLVFLFTSFIGFIVGFAIMVCFLLAIIFTAIYATDVDSYNSYHQGYCKVISVEQYNKTCSGSCSTCYYNCYSGKWNVSIGNTHVFNNASIYREASIDTSIANLQTVVTDWLAAYKIGSVYKCWFQENNPTTAQWSEPNYPTDGFILTVVFWSILPILCIIFCIDIVFAILFFGGRLISKFIKNFIYRA